MQKHRKVLELFILLFTGFIGTYKITGGFDELREISLLQTGNLLRQVLLCQTEEKLTHNNVAVLPYFVQQDVHFTEGETCLSPLEAHHVVLFEVERRHRHLHSRISLFPAKGSLYSV